MEPAGVKRLLPTTVLAGLLIALGIVLRLAGFLAGRSLWRDEVAVALNLRFRDFQGLFRLLDYDQTMPIALLQGVKAIVSVTGFSEYSLRLLFLIAGCLLLFALWLTFARFLGRDVALIALGLAALWRPLIYYSSELKQYGCDALITVITLWFALNMIDGKDCSRWRALIVWGAAAILLSQPAVFVLAAAGIAAMLDRRFVYSKQWRIYCGIAAIGWLAEFAALFWFSYRYTSGSAYMRSYWASSFLNPGLPDFRNRFLEALWTALGTRYFTDLRSLVLAALAIAGVREIWKRRGIQGVVIAVGPCGLLFGAAMLKQYPIADRLILFAIPLLFWIYASGVTTVASLLPEKFRSAAAAVLACALLGPMARASVAYATHFPAREATRQVVAKMNATDPRAPVYLVFSNYLQWAYYAGDWSRPGLLKEKVDRAYSCTACADLTYPGSAGVRTEIVGSAPPNPPSALADEQWAAREAGAIAAVNGGYVWLFLPIYDDIYRPRNLLEMLLGKLGERGAQSVDRYMIGDSIAIRYALAPM